MKQAESIQAYPISPDFGDPGACANRLYQSSPAKNGLGTRLGPSRTHCGMLITVDYSEDAYGSRTRTPVHLLVDSHRLYRTVACSSRSACTRCVAFFALPSLSEYSGRLATHGWWHVLCDGGILHSLPMIDLL